MTVLNGCDIRRFDKYSRKCRKCTNNSYCARKKAEPISYDRPMRDEVTKGSKDKCSRKCWRMCDSCRSYEKSKW